jgi:hypothetical protein
MELYKYTASCAVGFWRRMDKSTARQQREPGVWGFPDNECIFVHPGTDTRIRRPNGGDREQLHGTVRSFREFGDIVTVDVDSDQVPLATRCTSSRRVDAYCRGEYWRPQNVNCLPESRRLEVQRSWR